MACSQINSVMLAMLLLAAALVPEPAFADQDRQTFAITIRNVTTGTTLKLADGTAIGAPIAPGVFVVVGGDAAVFEAGRPAGEAGLESLAEDGNAEPLIASLEGKQGVRQTGIFIPGQPFKVALKPGERLVFATMFVQSNDKFYAPDPAGIDLFDASGAPKSGDLTADVKLWDAGTEQDEAPGSGDNQAPRQKAPNTGRAENGVVKPVSDGFAYPAVEEVLQLTVSPA